MGQKCTEMVLGNITQALHACISCQCFEPTAQHAQYGAECARAWPAQSIFTQKFLVLSRHLNFVGSPCLP